MGAGLPYALKKSGRCFSQRSILRVERGNKITKRWTCCVHRSQAF